MRVACVCMFACMAVVHVESTVCAPCPFGINGETGECGWDIGFGVWAWVLWF